MQASLLEDFVSSDTNFSIGKIMLAQQRASFVAGRLRLLWHNFQVEDFWQAQHRASLISGRLRLLWYHFLMLETLSPLNITSFGNTSSKKSSLLYTRKENALLFRVSQTCSKNFLAMLSHVIHCHFHFLVLPQSEIYYFSRQYFNTSALVDIW